jgi:hypothetical protein
MAGIIFMVVTLAGDYFNGLQTQTRKFPPAAKLEAAFSVANARLPP